MPELDGGTRNESVPDGLVSAVAESNHELYTSRGQADKAAADPAATGAEGAQNTHTETQKQKQEKKNEVSDEENESDNAEGLDSQDYSREIPTKEEAPVEEVKEEASTSQFEADPEIENWFTDLPAAPGEFTLEAPKADEYGQVDQEEFTKYLLEKVKYDNKVESYNAAYATKAFETAEKILPELKTNESLQQLIKQTFLSDPSDPKNNPVEVAKGLRSVFQAKEADGASNAKTHIEIQKAATVEKTGERKPKPTVKKNDNFERRLSRNDTSAFEELMGAWIDDGKV